MTISCQTDRATFEGRDANEPTLEELPAPHKATKLDLMVTKLMQPNGATIADLMAITGWQAHSVRGALAGALKKEGYVILSEKIDGLRHYRIGDAPGRRADRGRSCRSLPASPDAADPAQASWRQDIDHHRRAAGSPIRSDIDQSSL